MQFWDRKSIKKRSRTSETDGKNHANVHASGSYGNHSPKSTQIFTCSTTCCHFDVCVAKSLCVNDSNANTIGILTGESEYLCHQWNDTETMSWPMSFAALFTLSTVNCIRICMSWTIDSQIQWSAVFMVLPTDRLHYRNRYMQMHSGCADDCDLHALHPLIDIEVCKYL